MFALKSRGLVISSNFNDLKLLGSLFDDFFLYKLPLLLRKLQLLVGQDLASHLEESLFVGIECLAGGLQSVFGLEFFGVFFFDGFADILHFRVSIFVAVVPHCETLFFFDRARPDLHVIDFLVLGHFESLQLQSPYVLEEGHDEVIVEVVFSLEQGFDPVVTNFVVPAVFELLEDLSGSGLSGAVELVHQLVPFAHRLILLFLDFKLDALLLLFLLPQLEEVLHLLLEVLGDELLILGHL